jgi:hypothetical protein
MQPYKILPDGARQRVVEATLSQPWQALGSNPAHKFHGVYLIRVRPGVDPAKLAALYGWANPFITLALNWLGDHRVIYAGVSIGSGGVQSRILSHLNSIKKARNLDVEDFEYCALCVHTDMALAVESWLIQQINPLWNQTFFMGLGNGEHDWMTWWDVHHPGREQAEGKLLPTPWPDGLTPPVNIRYTGTDGAVRGRRLVEDVEELAEEFHSLLGCEDGVGKGESLIGKPDPLSDFLQMFSEGV